MPDPAPFPETLTTARLTLRVPTAEDGPAMAALVNANLEHLRPWLPWAQMPRTPEQQQGSMARAHDKFLQGEDLMYLMLLEGQPIGSCGIHRIDWAVPSGDIGYWLDQRREGHGYVTETARALTELALKPAAAGGLGFERLEIRCDARNLKSAAVPERLGFELEARLKRHARDPQHPEQFRDTLIFARWPHEY
ncbi:GNAT family N-acetyltransferase [Deinococcus rubellus]|uniref:GNAT family N-acetyltransferase n=1 Tax=Deinococcus rubellus TaxID=1889240 RepID=A0ABY5YHY9_9DEIO|nr:GNAT family N-acetyltransferase [Deinococcus rubellus]UWX64306.1 GNAT family N-acetyltransferase [Deinococcus rubellus]